MYSNFYTKYTVPQIITKKKAKQPSFIPCTDNKWGYTSSVLHFVSQSEDTADWGSGFRLFLSLCFYLFNWKFLQQWTRTSIKNKERDRKKKKVQLFLYLRVYYHLRRTLCSVHNSYNSHIFKNIGSYSISHHLWRKAKWTNRNIPRWAKASVLFWRQTPNTCLKLQLTLEKTLHSLESRIKQ